MKILLTILIGLQLVHFGPEVKNIHQFARTQNDFQVVKAFKAGYFVNSIENQGLHKQKLETFLKANKSHSNRNSYEKTVFTRIQLWQFDFATEEKYRQAKDSLLNCFPNDCAKIKRQTNQTIKVTPSIFILGSKRIIIASTACEQVDEKWKNFKREFADNFADNDSEIIITTCGKLTWTTKEEIKNLP